MPEWENSKSLGVAMTSDSVKEGGRPQIGGEIKTRDRHAIVLALYPGSHVRPNAEGTARNRRPTLPHCGNALRVPPPAQRVLAAE